MLANKPANAVALAGSPLPDTTGSANADRRQMLRLQLSEEHYGIPIELVREILQVGAMTPVPMMPAFVCGVMNLRGAVVPVLDLGRRLNLAPTVIGRRTCIVVLEIMQHEGPPLRHGVLVDSVQEVQDLPPGSVVSPPALGTRVPPPWIAGVLLGEARSVELLDIPRIFDEADLSRLVAEHCQRAAWVH